MSQDYVESFNAKRDAELLHHGVKGQKWGIRRSRGSVALRSTKSKPTRARVKEKISEDKAKQHAALTARIEKVKAGGRPLIVNGKQLSRAESVKHLEAKAKKLAPKGGKTEAKKSTESETTKVKLADGTEVTVSKTTSNTPPRDFNTLRTMAKQKKLDNLTDEELRILNTRTDALNKARNSYAKKKSPARKALEGFIAAALKKKLTSALTDTVKGKNDKTDPAAPKPKSTKTTPHSAPFRTWATQSGPAFRSTPLKALPSAPVFKITSLGD